jgi:prefoldin subunit 5
MQEKSGVSDRCEYLEEENKVILARVQEMEQEFTRIQRYHQQMWTD